MMKNFFLTLSAVMLNYGPSIAQNVLSRTNAAIIKYQKDNNLPSGNLNLMTLKSLDVK